MNLQRLFCKLKADGKCSHKSFMVYKKIFMLLKIVAVQLYSTVSPEHPGEYAPVHVSAYHGWFLSSQGGCRRRLGLDCWQVSYYNEIDHKMSPFHDHEIVFSPFSPLIKEGEINSEGIV